MTEAPVVPRFTCSEAGCEIASGGACLDGFESATICPHATETADMVFLAAGDDDVARVYERVGFARLATTAVADRRSAC